MKMPGGGSDGPVGWAGEFRFGGRTSGRLPTRQSKMGVGRAQDRAGRTKRSMRTCHACQNELSQASVLEGKCPHCGALLRKLSQRTIDATKLREANAKSLQTPAENDLLLSSDERAKAELTDTDQPGATIESKDLEIIFDDDAPLPDDDATPMQEVAEAEASEIEHGTPTIDSVEAFDLDGSFTLELTDRDHAEA